MTEHLEPCPNPWCPAGSRRVIIWDLYCKRVICSCGVKGPRSETRADTNEHSIPINNDRQQQAIAEAIAAWNTRTHAPIPSEAELVEIASKSLSGPYENAMTLDVVSTIITALRPYIHADQSARVVELETALGESLHIADEETAKLFRQAMDAKNDGDEEWAKIHFLRRDVASLIHKKIKALKSGEEG